MNPDKPAQGSKIPDLYGLLSLAPQEPDEQKIKSALRQFADQIKQEEDSGQAKAAAKLFAIAKHNLLEPSRKAAYDSLWLKVYGGPTVTHSELTAPTNGNGRLKSELLPSSPAVTVEPVWDLSELKNILPSGDVDAPLDLAGFLESTDSSNGHRSLEDLDRDFQRLVQLLGGEIGSAPTRLESDIIDSQINSRPYSNSMSGSAFDVKQTSASDSQLASISTPKQVMESPKNIISGSRRKRKNRDLPLLLMIGGGITALLVVLGVLVLMLNRKPTSNEMRPVASTDNGPRKALESVATNLPPKSSGLPQVGSGLPQPGETLLPPESGTSQSPMTEAPAMEQASASPGMETAPALSSTPGSISPGEKPIVPSNSPDITPQSVAIPSSSEPHPPISLTDKEKSDWKKLLSSARQSLTKREFTAARETLEKAAELAKTDQQKSQLARIETVLPLVEQFHEAIHKAASTRITESFKVGTQDIMLVEASDEKLVVKVKGSTKRYQWEEVPIGIAYGLADLELDPSPKSAACKAAFAAVHGRNGTAMEEARKLMQAAAAANIVPPDTHEVFDDKYSLD